MDADRETRDRTRSWRERDTTRRETAGRDATTPEPPPEATAGPPPEAAPPPPRDEVAAEPASTDVERRTTTERRTRVEPVEEERRVEARRARDQESRLRRQRILDQVTLGVDYAFYVLYGLLGIRFVLSLLGAAETAGFVVFIHGITNPFYAPFSGIVARPAINGGVLDFPLVIALLAYVLLHVAIRGLLRLLAGDRA